MTKDKALKLALEALELCNGAEIADGIVVYTDQEITAIKEALAQPEQKQTGIREIRVTETVKQKPVAWMCDPFGDDEYEFSAHQECENCVPCYAIPPKREWVGLTDGEREEIENRPFSQNDWLWFYTYAIEAKLKEKNT